MYIRNFLLTLHVYIQYVHIMYTYIYVHTYVFVPAADWSLQIFSDLANNAYFHDKDVSLSIHDDRVLGKGGYGFVCEGELHPSVHVRPMVYMHVYTCTYMYTYM